ncbi:MAG TPA: bifunctional diaminohydroxyphosphoribosylaminopyrimidine deaminase/5-amino-6-(5-phosphoribosylamino)uracil reductase RibD [Chthoniobacterales bacterium]|nr:bifunctional diaminohydroxyphosphoribosylaminopyrimidine deaminase/5-amino-6-(5-phosphoribosylamino)uracil reductase RibD [Chthoniobacterales bacterium]
MNFADADERFMRVALNEARKSLGRTSPNPAVGAILVCGGRILARAHHTRAGEPHAEIACLHKLGGPVPADATLYVTLEPCSTTGKTPPCTRAIIDAGVRTVVIGAVDVNPRHSGRGISELRNAGVMLRTGVLASESLRLNEAFNKWIVTRRPFVIAKCGLSLDGRLNRPRHEQRWITDAVARRDVHRLRAQVDAILVGAETVRQDNPRLTVRGVKGAKQPWRVVITRSGVLPKNARLFSDRWAKRTIVYRHKSLAAVLQDLGRQEIVSVLLEGGGRLLGAALDGGLIDKVQIYLGPILTGGGVAAFAGRGAFSTQAAEHLEDVTYTEIGQSIRITGYLRNAAKELGE